MGKSTRRKQEEEAAQELKYTERLSARGADSGKAVRGVVRAADIITPSMRNINRYRIRPIRNWVYTGKSRKIEKQRLELLRHLYGMYPVPRFLERAVVNDEKGDQDFAEWYVVAAQGKSLYKLCTCIVMSKKETHFFLQAPDELDVRQAVWWAKAMVISNDIGISYRMARSCIAQRENYENEFWVDVHRFFTNNPVSLTEMTNLIDYICAERREDESWTIKKRSLEAIRRKSEEWHRAQWKMKQIGGGAWDGMGIPNWHFVTGKFDPNPQRSTRVDWFIQEVLTGNDLVREGQKMRHCVGSYKTACMNGRTSIFSMTSNTPTRREQRNLTIEVERCSRRIVQIAGYAGRRPRPHERAVLNRWAHDKQLTVRSYW